MYMNKKELMILEELSCLKLSEQEQECMISDLEKMLIYMELPRETAKKVLADAQIDEKARGETLSPQRLALFADVLLDNGVYQEK